MEGEHQLADQAFPGRMRTDEVGDLVEDARVPGEPELGVEAVLDGDEAGLVQSVAELVADLVRCRTRQRLARPQRERVAEQPDRPLVGALLDSALLHGTLLHGTPGGGTPGGGDQRAEPVDVHRQRVDLDPVARPLADHRRRGAEHAAEPGDADLDRLPGTARWHVRPQELHQAGRGYDVVGLEE